MSPPTLQQGKETYLTVGVPFLAKNGMQWASIKLTAIMAYNAYSRCANSQLLESEAKLILYDPGTETRVTLSPYREEEALPEEEAPPWVVPPTCLPVHLGHAGPK